MEFTELKNIFLNLKNLLENKKQAIVKNEIETLNQIDEEIIVINGQFSKIDLKKELESLDVNEKEEIKNILKEIKILENNNEALIKHSLDVINGLLNGILNITTKKNDSYNSYGKNNIEDDTYRFSSITEEA